MMIVTMVMLVVMTMLMMGITVMVKTRSLSRVRLFATPWTAA